MKKFRKIFIVLFGIVIVSAKLFPEYHDSQQITSYEYYTYTTGGYNNGGNNHNGSGGGSNGGGSGSGGSGGPGGSGYGGGENSDYQEKSAEEAALRQEEKSLENKSDSISAGEESNASDTASENEQKKSDEVSDAENQNEKSRDNNRENSKSDKNSENSDTSGDPVKVTKGSYVQEETDIVIGSKNQFEIKRRYESENKITGSFGYGWYTNLDERIILGTEPDLQNIINKYQQYQSDLNKIISHLEKELASAYKVSSIYKAKEELKVRIEKCNSCISQISAFLTKASNFKNRVRAYSNLENSAGNIYSSALSLKSKTERKKSTLQKLYNRVDYDLEIISRLKKRKAEAEEELNRYILLKKEDDVRRLKNKKVMFSGMQKYYEDTGLNSITIIDENGYPHILYESEENRWKNNDDIRYDRCEVVSEGYKLFECNGTIKHFDSNGFLTKCEDINGNYVLIERNNAELIKQITTSLGEQFSFDYSSSFISEITNMRSSDETMRYSYNERKLVSVKDTDGDTVSMEYNSDKRLTSLIKCDGSRIKFNYEEIATDGSVLATSTENEEGFSERFIYYRDEKHTDYIDHDGNKTSYWYNDNNQTIREVRPDGTVIINTYSDKERLQSASENGDLIVYDYDDKGNKVSARYSDGSHELWTYDDFNNVITYSDRDNVLYEYLRDEKGNIVEYKCGSRTVYSQEFDSRGFVIKKIGYGGTRIITEYQYDKYGNLIEEKNSGNIRNYFYDNRNRIIREVLNGKVLHEYSYKDDSVTRKDYNGLKTELLTNGRKDIYKIIQTDEKSGAVHQIKIDYDKRHLPVFIYTGDGKTEELKCSYAYTAEGKLKAEIFHGEVNWIKLYKYTSGFISEIRQISSTSNLFTDFENIPPVQTFKLDIQYKNEKRLTVTDGSGIQNIFEYDSHGSLIRSIDGNGECIRKEFSSGGRLLFDQTQYGGRYGFNYDSSGLVSKSGEENSSFVKTSYNPDGSVSTRMDRNGIVTKYSYNAFGQISCIEDCRKKELYEYDTMGRRITKTIIDIPHGNKIVYSVSYSYSDDGRSLTVIEGNKYKIENELDAFGNIVSQTDGDGNKRFYEYDCQNRLIKSIDGYNNQTIYTYNALGKINSVIYPDGAETKYTYNYMGELESISDDCGLVYSASYDKSGRIIKEKTRAESEKKYEYDSAGRIVKTICGDEIEEKYSYGTNGKTVTVTDGAGNDYCYKYDSFGKLVSEKNRNGFEQYLAYDPEGELKTKNTFSNEVIEIKYSSDRNVRIVKYSDGTQNRFTFDAAGNIIEIENTYGRTVYQYDEGGRLICQKEIATGEEIIFEYDNAGNRIKLCGSNMDTAYFYGNNNELKEVFDNKQRLRVQLKYDKNGREVVRQFGNGTTEETLYDKAGRVTVKMQKSEHGDLLWGEGYVYGADGKRTATVDNSGRVTLYEYNKAGRLSTVYYPYSDSFMTEAGENRYLSSTERASFVPLLNAMQYGLAYKLSNLQIFIKQDYSYDSNGNMISKDSPFERIEYSYDKENYLVSSISNGQNRTNYNFDKMGNLLSEESECKTIRYSYNLQNRLVSCEITDNVEKTYSKSSYAYDAFGRRVLVQDKDEVMLRTVYDGLTFDVIKQSPVFENGTFTDSYETGIHFGKTGRPTGDRYRYLNDEIKTDSNRYYYLDENAYKSVSDRYHGERTILNVNGTVAAQSTSDYGVNYFSTDLLGSVRTMSDSHGSLNAAYTYDAFGMLQQGEFTPKSVFGYLGKQFDSTSKLYNYGYRDYSPTAARFTTLDPIRDGPNWFAYCNNDPVNFVDLLGLAYRDRYGVWRSSTDSTYELEIAMNNHQNDSYIKPEDTKQGESSYRCDDYVQTVLKEAGVYKKESFAGDSQQKTVSDHINNAKQNGVEQNDKSDAPKLNNGDTYIVLMGDSDKGYSEHCGITRIGSDGSVYFTDNSSGNSNHGVQTSKYENLQQFQNDYGYNSFYYESVNTKEGKAKK